MELFKLLGTIAIDNKDANKGLDDTGKKGEQTQSKLSKALGGIGKGASIAGKAVMTGLAAGATAMGALTIKALNMAGDLEQNMGGSEQVFKQYASEMQNTAKSAFSNMGLSTNDFLQTANKMGALFQGAGFDVKESMDLSSDAMQRAADVASIMGIDTNAAMEAIAGAAKGNFTMMDNLGVAMNDTTLNAYALEKGINKTTQEMTNQEKIGLAMEMFMDKTAYAAGNYAKENQTLAGSLGTAKAALTNFLDGSGSVEDLVGAFGNAANVIVDNITKLAPRLITGIVDLVNQVIPMIPPLLNALIPPVLEGAIGLMNGLIQALPLLMETLLSALPTLIPMLIDGLVSMITMLATMLPEIIQPIIEYLPEIIVTIVDSLMQNLPLLVEAGGQILMGLLEGMVALISKIPSVLGKIFTSILNGIKSLFGIHSQSTVMMNIGRFIMQGLIDGIKNLLGKITEVWNRLKSITVNAFNKIKEVASNVWNGIKTTVSTVVNNVKNAVSKSFNTVKNTVGNVFSSIKSTASTTWNGIKNAITNPIEKARDKIKSIVSKIKGMFSGMKLSFPKIKVPRFTIKPSGWKIGDLLKGIKPTLGITWHKKAMRNPMIMNKPTVFGYDATTGKLLGGGEAGSEVVSGTVTLMNMISAAVASQNAGVVGVLYKILAAILEMDANMGGNLREALDGVSLDVNKREFARLVKGAI